VYAWARSRSRVFSESTAPPPSAITEGGPCEGFRDDLLLEPPELGLSALEELRDGPVEPLDLGIRVHERAGRALGDLAPDRRLPRPHEADEGEVLP
jgi:hypothetical protein